MADLGGSLGGILNVLGAIGNFFRGISKKVANAIASVALQVVGLAKATAGIFTHVGNLFVNVAGFFRRVWQGLLSPMVRHLNGWLVKIATSLRDWFAPVVRIIKKIRKRFLDEWNRYVRPVLDTIDVIRRVMRLLGKLGIDSAKAVDQKLGRLEAKIQAPMFAIVRQLNLVTEWVNRIVTVDGVLQEIILLTSIDKWKREILGIGLRSVTRPLTADEQQQYDAPYPTVTLNEHVNDMRAFASGDESWVRVKAEAWAADVLALRAAAR